MNNGQTKAFGKLMLAGEYSVLFGGMALVFGLKHFATCKFSEGETLDFVGLSTGVLRNHNHPLFRASLLACEKISIVPKIGCYTVDTSAFYEGPRKLGFGSSSAAISALVKMFFHNGGVEDQQLLLKTAIDAHKQFAQGFGSGA